MANIYIKNEAGEFEEASDRDLEEVFKEKSDRIVSSRLTKIREKETARIREEIESEVRQSAEDKIKTEVTEALKAEYETKLKETNSQLESLGMQFRRKIIAAEYGFKPETEGFLGTGSEEEMRKNADILKANFGNVQTSMEKNTESSNVSDIQKNTGVVIDI